MSGQSFYYTTFSFKAQGLEKVLSEFKAVSAQITAQSAALGKVNFSGMAGAIPILKNIDNSLTLIGTHLNLFSSQSAKLGQVFAPMSAGATKASAATKSVTTSMTQLQAISGQVSSSTARVTSSMSAMGAAGKAAFGGIVSGAERSIAAMSALSAATMSVGRSMARMGTLAAIPMAGMRGLSGAITGSLLASSAGMLLNPFNAAPLAAGYGVYTQGNVGKAASEAAAKSWQPGMSQQDIDAIKQSIMSNSRAAAGQSIYSSTDIAKMWSEYAGMGGDVSAGKITDSLSKVFTNYAQAINAPDIGTALNTLVSQNMVWNGQEKAFNEDTLRNTSDMMAMLVAQTKLKGPDLNDLLKDVSPVAKAYGMSQEETLAMTGGMAQLGLNPQQAGMALRRILLRGTPNVSALEKQDAWNQGITNEKGNIIDSETGKEISLSYVNQALDQLDLTWADINPEKNTNGIVGVFQDIASKMKEAGMSPEQQQAWMKTVYGLQGVTPAQMLTQNPEYLLELYEKIKKASEGRGASSWMSEIMTDNMIDQFKMLGSAVKGTAQDIGAYFEPSVVKLTKFLKDSALPGLNSLGSALAAGDWKGVADIAGSALDFIGEKFTNSGPVLTDWINNGIDGLDEFASRYADFMTGGGETSMLDGLKNWAKGIWSDIDWGQVDTITANLSTGLNAAWDQSMAWFQTQIDGINWDNVGSRLGEALEWGFDVLLTIADKIPWSSLTTAATNALTGIIIKIDWGTVVTDAINVGEKIGVAIYNGIAASNLGVLFQNWAIDFENSLNAAIASISGSLAGLAVAWGASIETAQKIVNLPKVIVEKTEEAVENLEPAKVHEKYFSTSYNTPGETGLPNQMYNFALGNSWNDQTGEKNKAYGDNDNWFGGQSLGGALRTAAPLLGLAYDALWADALWASPSKTQTPTQTKSQTIIVPSPTPPAPVPVPAAPAAPIGSGKFDTITGSEILKGARLWQSALDKNKYIGEEGYALLDAGSKPNFADVGVAGETFSRTPAQRERDFVAALRKSDVLKEMYSGNKAPDFAGYSVDDKVEFDASKYQTQISSSMTGTYVPGKGIVSHEGESDGPPLVTKVENAVRSAAGLSPSSGSGGSDRDLAGLAAKNAETDKKNAQNTEQSALSLDQINSGIKNLGDKDIVNLSGTNAKGEPYQKEFYKADINDAAKELINKGFKITDVSTQKGQESPVSLASTPAATAAAKDSVTATKKSEVATKESTDATNKSISALMSLDSTLGRLVSSLDYSGISEYVKGKYGVDNPLTPDVDERDKLWSAKDWEQADVRGDLAATAIGYTNALNQKEFISPKVIDTVEEIDDNTKGTKDFVSKLAAVITPSMFKEVFGSGPAAPTLNKNSASSPQIPFVNQNEVQEEYDPKFYRSYIGATEGYIPWLEQEEGSRRISSWGLGAAGKLNGLGLTSGNGDIPTGPYTTQEMINQAIIKIAPQLNEGELIKLKEKIESEGFNADLLIDTSEAETSLTDLKSEASKSTNSKHSIFADNSAPLQAISLNKQPTWSQHTIYVNQVTNFSKGTSTLSSGGIFSFDAFKSPIKPAFAEGGYTGTYQGEATVHPHEVILNAAQQRGVADSIDGKSGKNVTIHIDARGAIITDNGMDTLVVKIKSALQDDGYR